MPLDLRQTDDKSQPPSDNMLFDGDPYIIHVLRQSLTKEALAETGLTPKDAPDGHALADFAIDNKLLFPPIEENQ